MKPLIKWAGGKSSEIKYIEKIIPSKFDRYIEPFFGGGALFFHLEPKQAIINDISKELIMFYSFIQNGKRNELKKELDSYVKYWSRINIYVKKFGNSFIVLYEKYRHNKISDEKFEIGIGGLFEKKIVPFNGLFAESFCVDKKNLMESIEKNVISKLKRIKHKIDRKNGFSKEMIMKNIETAFRSGFYMHFRNIMNKSRKNGMDISEAKRIANYYFVREFCYGSMFRFNSEGDFNVPYGGIAYNKKDFKNKVEIIFSDSVRRLIKKATIENVDFEKLIKKYKPTKNDFIFFDPPYDTEFSEYEESPFTKEDQKRLAECIIKMGAKFILIIKETKFIRELYETEEAKRKGIKIESFGKKYMYNIRGRNVRDVNHLIIHNLKSSQTTLF